MNGVEVLIIEDEPDIAELVQYNLEKQSFKVHSAQDGEVGLKMARAISPDLILLDIMLPGMDGLQVCRTLRQSQENRATPIIMLSAKGEESDIVVGLELGADDYIPKPFSPKELTARIRAVLRRTKKEQAQIDFSDEESKLAVGPLVLDPIRYETSLRGESITLTLAEFKLLYHLMSKPGRVFTRDQLLNKIGGGDTYLVDRNVDVHVRAIRKKLGSDANFIVTIRGIGYKCKSEAPLA